MADALSVIGAIGGVLGGAGALWAAVVAHGAKGDAARSATAAEDSARAAQGSLHVSRAERDRAVERADVTWRRDEVQPERGLVVLRNVGTTTARDARIALTVNGRRVDLAPGDVPPDGTVEHDASEVWAEAARERNRIADAMRRAGIVYVASTEFRASARITWHSDLGTPGLQVMGEDD